MNANIKGLAVLLLLVAGIFTPHDGRAQGYPNRLIKIVSPYAAGGTNDLLSRIVARKLTERLGQSVVVENRLGAGGAIGADFVAKAAPDGYTLIMGNSGTHGLLPNVRSDLPYDAEKDFTPIALVATLPLVFVVNNSLPVGSVKEFIEYARRNSGRISFGSSGNAGSAHLAGEMLKAATGLDMVHIPYKGDAPAVTDLIAANITCLFVSAPSVAQHIKSGRLKALAMTGATRVPALPDLPTMTEAGVPGVEVYLWFGIMGPANLPRDVVDILSREILQMGRAPEVIDLIRSQGAEPHPLNPVELTAFIKSERAKYGAIIRKANIKLE